LPENRGNVWNHRWSVQESVRVDLTTTTVFNEILKHVSFEDKSVLELGAGTGRLSFLALQRGAKHVTLVDSSEQAMRLAKGLFCANNQVEFVYGDLLGLNLPEKSFDIVMSSGVMEHFKGEDLAKAVQAHKRFLKPEGLAVIVVPSSPHFNNIRCRLPSNIRSFGYWRPFSKSRLSKLLKSQSFTVRAIERFFLTYGFSHIRRFAHKWNKRLQSHVKKKPDKSLLKLLFLPPRVLLNVMATFGTQKPKWLNSRFGGLIIVAAGIKR
jgi:ubiquinone/menaquinone biosynthesis C-methylase UbiE